MKTLSPIVALAALLLFLFSTYASAQVIELPSVAASNSVWASPKIPVCWENADSSLTSEKLWVQDAVTKTWQKYGNLYFDGWAACPSTTASGQGIRIVLADENPRVRAIGRYLDGMREGMVLNFTFDKWSTDCKTRREFCIRTIAVHEFGHALGFTHEQNRSDTPPCGKEPQGPNGDWYITPWDLDSVMNYCNPNWSGGGNLSAGDVVGVRTLYPTFSNAKLNSSVWYTMESRSTVRGRETSSCLHVLNNNANPGNPISQWPCLKAPEFKFKFEAWPDMPVGYYRIRSTYGKCFTVSKKLSSLPVRRNSLVQADCVDEQEFRYLIEVTSDDWYRIKAMDGMCYHVANGPTTAPRMPLWSWECINQPEFFLRLKLADF